MNVSRLCEDLQTGIGPLFTCMEQGEYLRVRTPYLYPDGDYIDIFCKVDGDVWTVSDLAETTGWLRMQSATLRRSPKQRMLIEDVCVTHGIEFHRGMLQARCHAGEELPQVVTRVAQAALRVSDLWFTLRPKTVSRQERTLYLDGRVPIDKIGDQEKRSRFRWWMTDSANILDVDHKVFESLTGTVFEIRQGYKSKDSKRQNADLANAATAYTKGYLPCAIILSDKLTAMCYCDTAPRSGPL